MRLTKAIRAGTIGVNGFQIEPHAAFGGHRQSKTVLLPLTENDVSAAR
jgi:acyl-CoA reductase-like NAD-dependent aldehyde dehydrogenase